MPVYDPRTGELPVPRLPRLGIIRLGYKTKGKGKDAREYPVAADHFILNEEDGCEAIREIYGDEPTSLDVMFPGEDDEIIAPHWLRSYSSTWGLVCMGDRRSANRKAGVSKDGELLLDDEGTPRIADRDAKATSNQRVSCPCPRLEKGDCKETMYLRFLLPDVPGLGVWQISTGSINGILNLQGMFSMLRGMFGRISNIPLKLELCPQRIGLPGGGHQTNMILNLALGSKITPNQLMESIKGMPTLMPVIELPDDDQEEMPEDAVSEGGAMEPEAEEAEYANKDEIAANEHFCEEHNADRPSADSNGNFYHQEGDNYCVEGIGMLNGNGQLIEQPEESQATMLEEANTLENH